jgi:hypothetical protein
MKIQERVFVKMEKEMSFSKQQKSLICSRFVWAKGGTEEEARYFVRVCETFGLNPIFGIVRFKNMKQNRGARTNFITTCDGLLYMAAQNPDYVSAPYAEEVRKGEDFKNLSHPLNRKI